MHEVSPQAAAAIAALPHRLRYTIRKSIQEQLDDFGYFDDQILMMEMNSDYDSCHIFLAELIKLPGIGRLRAISILGGDPMTQESYYAPAWFTTWLEVHHKLQYQADDLLKLGFEANRRKHTNLPTMKKVPVTSRVVYTRAVVKTLREWVASWPAVS